MLHHTNICQISIPKLIGGGLKASVPIEMAVWLVILEISSLKQQ